MQVNESQKFSFDAASAISCGARDYQEDALVSEFSNGDDLGFVVLADGMGGHAAGDIASKIVVTRMFSELTFQRDAMLQGASGICDTLRNAAKNANECIENHARTNPDTKGMGSTLVSAVVTQGALHWISIGDSPLFLFRDGVLMQLNEDHSMSRQIDLMVQKGMLSEEEGEKHPDRNVLTSALFGAPIPQMDCPAEPVRLQAGDTVLVASDGLQFLDDDMIQTVLRDRPLSRSTEIADALIAHLMMLNDPDLDNVTISVIQVKHARQEAAALGAAPLLRPVPDPVLDPVEQAEPEAKPKKRGFFSGPAQLASKGRGLFAGKARG
ncbi:MAG: protein phosphatase 2C domain-containing protein [Pseudomonadota bacterium]